MTLSPGAASLGAVFTRRRLLVALAVMVVAYAALTLGLAQNWGWSTPFALPAVIGYHGHSYYIDTNTRYGRACLVSPTAFVEGRTDRLPRDYTPLRRVGAVFGYLTASNPILLPHYEWNYHLVYGLLVRDGHCLRYYTLPGGG